MLHLDYNKIFVFTMNMLRRFYLYLQKNSEISVQKFHWKDLHRKTDIRAHIQRLLSGMKKHLPTIKAIFGFFLYF